MNHKNIKQKLNNEKEIKMDIEVNTSTQSNNLIGSLSTQSSNNIYSSQDSKNLNNSKNNDISNLDNGTDAIIETEKMKIVFTTSKNQKNNTNNKKINSK